MRRADRITGATLVVLSLAFSAAALKYYTYWGENGPGPGFLPAWLGLVMAALGALLLVGSLRARGPSPDWLPDHAGLRRLALVMGATVAFVALLGVLGMALATALFIVVLVRGLGGHRWRLALGVAVGLAAINYLVFTFWLRVPFPVGVFGF